MKYRTKSHRYYNEDPEYPIDWGPWKEKFAWYPRRWLQQRIWLKTYYIRTGKSTEEFGWYEPPVTQITTSLFAVLTHQ